MRPLMNLIFTSLIFLTYANVQRPRADRDTHTKKRNTDHIDDILLRPDPIGYDDNDPNIKAVLKELETIYQKMIRPVEKQFKYADLMRHTMSDVDIYAKPIILLVGPWSTGKSTMINYLLGIEGSLESLYVGAEPTTGDFTVLSYADEYRTVEGVVLATDATKPFASMEIYGQIFLEHLLGVEMNKALLRNVTFIDTPGILENRRQQERGYPYNDVMRWLVHRSDLIFVVFDPTKLDVGYELETLFRQLKGKESVLRIILNKADSIPEQDLMRVYGALFWSLSPLINVTEPPRVYVGSFWSEPFHDDDLSDILLREEKSLLHDMREVIRNRVYNKIAFVRQYAIRVRIHALLVDSYVSAYRRNKGLFANGDEIAKQIIEDPESYDVFTTVLSNPNISKYDLPDPEEYEEFFKINPLTEQRRISEHCGYFAGCAIDLLNRAISNDLPVLLRRFRSPNQGGKRRGQQQREQKPFDKPEFMPPSEIKATLEAVKKHASENLASSAETGAKKYRKSAKTDQPAAPAPEEMSKEEEVVSKEPAGKRKGKFSGEVHKSAAKTASVAAKTTKSKKSTEKPAATEVKEQAVPAAMKDHPKRVKKSKEKKRYEQEEVETPTPEEVKVVEPEPEPEPEPVPVTVPIPSSEEKNEDAEVEISAESEEEEPLPEPPAPPAPKPKAHKVASNAQKARKESSPPVEQPKQASPKKSKDAGEVKSKKITGEKLPKSSKAPAHKQPVQEPEIGHKGSVPPVAAAAAAEGVKCNKYRKSCPENEQLVTPMDSPKENPSETHHKGSPKKKEPEADKKSTAAKKPQPVPQPATPTASSGSSKCNKFRKSCQNEEDDKEKVDNPAPKAQMKKAAEPAPKPVPVVAVPAPSGAKCNKFRKSCQTDEETEKPAPKVAEPKKPAEKPKEAKKAPAKKEASPIPVAEKKSEPQKCNKYRKDCQQVSGDDDEKPKKAPVKESVKEQQQKKQKEAPAPAPAVQQKEQPAKCNKYRKDCQSAQDKEESSPAPPPKEKDQRKVAKKVEPNHDRDEVKQPTEDVKCTKNSYRKSCRGKNEDDDESAPPVVAQKKQSASHPAPKEKKTESKKPEQAPPAASGDGKCNKFRKSCQTGNKEDDEPVEKPAPKREESKQQKPAKAAAQVPEPAQASAGGAPCNKYRKSCRTEAASENEAANPKANPKSESTATKADEKPKKLCKKNTTAAGTPAAAPAPAAKKSAHGKASKSAPAPAAPAPAPAAKSEKPSGSQNKWRKQKTPSAEQLVST